MENQEKSFEAWDKMASLYEDKFMHMDLYDDTYALFCEYIKKQNAKVFRNRLRTWKYYSISFI